MDKACIFLGCNCFIPCTQLFFTEVANVTSVDVSVNSFDLTVNGSIHT
jgi:hypothetical protein